MFTLFRGNDNNDLGNDNNDRICIIVIYFVYYASHFDIVF